MPKKTPDLDRSNLMVDGIADWLMESALNEQTSTKAVYQDTCIRLLAEGIPIIRAHLAFRTLHPLFAAITIPGIGTAKRNIRKLRMARLVLMPIGAQAHMLF